MRWRRTIFKALAFALALSATTVGKGDEPVATVELSHVVKGNTRFALDVYSRLRTAPGNLFFSPFSLSTALTMTSAGAAGETARQMKSTLRLPSDHASGYAALIDRVNGAGEPQPSPDTLASANALWLQPGEPFLPAFLETVQAQYAASLRPLDFAADPEAARRTINAWVEKQTLDKIRDLIASGVLSRDTSLVLTNAIYFKGAWQTPFQDAQTQKDQPFHAADGHDLKVALMAQTGSFRYHDGESFQALELPYKQNARAMIVLLPRTPAGLAELEASLDEANLTKWLGAMAAKRVRVELPRFKLTQSFEVSETLSALGMTDAFQPSKADFSGMTGHRDHFLSAVIHKAFVDVNEAGTEAAAATAVVMTRSSVIVAPDPIAFRADHPFVVLIRDQKTGSILFLGRLTDPKP